MKNPRFLIAKYAPDLHRMEPRNIGLFLWNKGRIVTKFLDAGEAKFVNEPSVYEEWIAYWNELVAGDEISVPGRPPVLKKSEDCLRSILATQDGNFIIADAGFIPADIPVKDMPKAVDFLFGELINDSREYGSHASPVKSSLQNACDEILSPLEKDARFHHDLMVTSGTEEDGFPPKFTYGFGDVHKPEVLLQIVQLTNEDQIRSAAQKFQTVAKDVQLIDRSHCACLVDSHKGGTAIHNRISFLYRYSGIVDVGNPETARFALANMGLPNLIA